MSSSNRNKSAEAVLWQYQTILFEFQKDGLLGEKYIDDEEVENLLNDQGRLGWELVNVTPVQEGLLAFLKKVRTSPVQQQKGISDAGNEAVPPEDSFPGRTSEHVQVRDHELVGRSEKKKANSPAKGDSDLFGGIKIS